MHEMPAESRRNAGRMPAVIYASLEAGAHLKSAAILAALMTAGF